LEKKQYTAGFVDLNIRYLCTKDCEKVFHSAFVVWKVLASPVMRLDIFNALNGINF